MRYERTLNSWEQFQIALSQIRATAGEGLLFRGQADSKWPLDTTLERRGCKAIRVLDYYRALTRILPQIESLTGRHWDLPTYSELENSLSEYQEFSLALSFGGFPGYGYLIYGRHHGFSSPLLDWTRSPYVAAYFAFAPRAENVAARSIYVWSEARMRGTGTNLPELKRGGPYVRTDRRHVLQQCDYTFCATFSTTTNEWRFTPQEATLAAGATAGGDAFENRLWKLDLPSTERLKVLRFLDDFNLNAFSLFETDESLMETLSIREFELKRYP